MIRNVPCSGGIQAHPSTCAAQTRAFPAIPHTLLPGLYARCDRPRGHQWCNNVFEELLNDPRRLHFVTNGEHGAHQHGTCKMMGSIQPFLPVLHDCRLQLRISGYRLSSSEWLSTGCAWCNLKPINPQRSNAERLFLASPLAVLSQNGNQSAGASYTCNPTCIPLTAPMDWLWQDDTENRPSRPINQIDLAVQVEVLYSNLFPLAMSQNLSATQAILRRKKSWWSPSVIHWRLHNQDGIHIW